VELLVPEKGGVRKNFTNKRNDKRNNYTFLFREICVKESKLKETRRTMSKAENSQMV